MRAPEGSPAARYVGHTVAGSPPPDPSAERTVWTSPEGCQQVVGSGGLGMWLITTSEGHMLLNTSMPGSGPMIEASVRKLHFDPKDIKLILTCHGHNDRVGRHKYLRALTGVKVAMIAEEAELLRSGGTTDFHTGTVPIFGFDGAEVWSRPS
jgi:glyoxylase-like metal-dependent hydrolase (beta-lactamase superfamily II)